MNQLKTLQSY
jgi:hypothetical protein